MNEIKLILADDHKLFRNGLKMLLGAEKGINIIAEAENGEELLELLKTKLPDIILMDIDMPVMDGIEATKNISERYKDINVIALSMFGDEEYYYKMIDAGVKGFILKNSEIDEVIKAIKLVNNNGTYFSQDILYSVIKNIKSNVEPDSKVERLSRRELEILSQICQGFSNQEIAVNLFLSKRTVEKHRANLLSKTGVKNTASLIIYAIKNKLIEM